MPYKPDFGMYFSQLGGNAGTVIDFYDVPVDHILIINKTMFTVFSFKTWEGTQYAVSFDFDMQLLRHLYNKTTVEVQQQLWEGLSGVRKFPYTIWFSKPVRITLKATIGESQIAANEQFIPFIVQEILPSVFSQPPN